MAGFDGQYDTSVGRICRHDIRISAIILYRTAQSLASMQSVSTPFWGSLVWNASTNFCILLAMATSSMPCQHGKELLPKGLRSSACPFTEPFEIVPIELYDIRADDTPGGMPENHQHDDVIELVTDIALA